MGVATQMLDACAGAGVREFCVCAGARNVELVVGLERSTGCRVWHFFDERSAAFFALGRMMKTGEPVAVVTTSGTAVAELLPATVEAYYQSLPLLLITAARPERFFLSGAPQAIEQEGIFGVYARNFCGDGMPEWDSPAHLNVYLEEPSVDSVRSSVGVDFSVCFERGETKSNQEWLISGFLQETDALVVMLGNLRQDERVGLREFLTKLRVPVLAEAGSGLREKLAGVAVRELPEGVKKVLRIGGVPSARFWRDLEELAEVEVLSVSRGRFSGLGRESEVVKGVDWTAVEVVAGDGEFQLSECGPSGEAGWFRFLSERIPEGALVMIGNSLPIRNWNAAATYDDRGLRCFSSRGANGIDGQLSTFFGLSVDEEAESWAIVGDLTAMYDLSAPWVLRELGGGKKRIVVINNGGGRIFSRLPALSGLADGERRAIENDHQVNLEHWAAMWGMGYVRVERESDFVVEDESVVIEIIVDGGRACE